MLSDIDACDLLMALDQVTIRPYDRSISKIGRFNRGLRNRDQQRADDHPA